MWRIFTLQLPHGSDPLDARVKKAPQQRVTFDGSGEFLKTVRARVQTSLEGQALEGDRGLQLKAAITSVWYLGSFAALLSVHATWLQLVLCISFGLAASAVGFNVFHDAGHGAMSRDRRVNFAVAVFASAILGPSRYLWAFKHNVLHHRNTNIHAWDDDLETRGFLRLSPEQDWKWRYRGQHFFVFILYAINAIEMVFVKDFVQYFTLRINEHQRIPAMSASEKIEFWLTKAVFFAIFVGLPFALLPAGRVLAGFLIYEFTVGLALALVFGMAHQVEVVAFPSPQGIPPTIKEEWAAHQMRTTANFATGNRVWNWYTGGLNHQIEHHLFPDMSHTHYAVIKRVVRDTAGEFDLPYHHFDTYGAALGSHYRLLRRLGTKPVASTWQVEPETAVVADHLT
jgi:linoleoyl-CoA desaturase